MKVSDIMKDLRRLDVPESRCLLAESHGESVVASAINLIEFIGRNFEADEARKLERKLHLAIENRDPRKLTRAIRRLRDPAKDAMAEAVATDSNAAGADIFANDVAIELAIQRALDEVEQLDAGASDDGDNDDAE